MLSFDKIKDFLLRNIAWVLLAVISLFLLSGFLPENQNITAIINTLLTAVVAESIAVALSSFASYAYTNIKFTKESYELDEEEDPEYSPTIRAAKIRVLGYIILSVHMLIGLTIFSVYLGMFYN